MKIGHSGKATILFGLGATIIYLVMVLGTLRYLSDLAGALPFDLRPSGYSQADTVGLLEALGGTGRHYYLTRQIPLDTLYPALDLSRFRSAPGAHLGDFSFESQGAFPA